MPCADCHPCDRPIREGPIQGVAILCDLTNGNNPGNNRIDTEPVCLTDNSGTWFFGVLQFEEDGTFSGLNYYTVDVGGNLVPYAPVSNPRPCESTDVEAVSNCLLANADGNGYVTGQQVTQILWFDVTSGTPILIATAYFNRNTGLPLPVAPPLSDFDSCGLDEQIEIEEQLICADGEPVVMRTTFTDGSPTSVVFIGQNGVPVVPVDWTPGACETISWTRCYTYFDLVLNEYVNFTRVFIKNLNDDSIRFQDHDEDGNDPLVPPATELIPCEELYDAERDILCEAPIQSSDRLYAQSNINTLNAYDVNEQIGAQGLVTTPGAIDIAVYIPPQDRIIVFLNNSDWRYVDLNTNAFTAPTPNPACYNINFAEGTYEYATDQIILLERVGGTVNLYRFNPDTNTCVTLGTISGLIAGVDVRPGIVIPTQGAYAGNVVVRKLNEIYTVNLNTMAATLIYTLPVPGSPYVSLAYDPNQNRLYAGSLAPGSSIFVNVETGDQTIIATPAPSTLAFFRYRDTARTYNTTPRRFIRTSFYNKNTREFESAIYTNLDGITPYTFTNNIVDCQIDTTQTDAKVLCDDNGSFLRRYVVSSEGTTVAYLDFELDGVTAYAPEGTVRNCTDNCSVTWTETLCMTTGLLTDNTSDRYLVSGPGANQLAIRSLTTGALVQPPFALPFAIQNLDILPDLSAAINISQSAPFQVNLINLNTGQPTLILNDIPGVPPGHLIIGLTKNFETNDFYIATKPNATAPMNIYRFNLDNAILTLVGTTQFSVAGTSTGDIAFTPGGRLFVSGDIASNYQIIEISPQDATTINVLFAIPTSTVVGPVTYVPRGLIGLPNGTLAAFLTGGGEIFTPDGVSLGVTTNLIQTLGLSASSYFNLYLNPNSSLTFTRVSNRDCEGIVTTSDYFLSGAPLEVPLTADVIECDLAECDENRFVWEQELCYTEPAVELTRYLASSGVPNNVDVRDITNASFISTAATLPNPPQALEVFPDLSRALVFYTQVGQSFMGEIIFSPPGLNLYGPVNGLPPGQTIRGAARNFETNQFYVLAKVNGNVPGFVYTFDFPTNTVTLIGATPFNIAINDQADIAIGVGGRMYITTREAGNEIIREVNPTTLAVIGDIFTQVTNSPAGPVVSQTFVHRSVTGMPDGSLMAFFNNIAYFLDLDGNVLGTLEGTGIPGATSSFDLFSDEVTDPVRFTRIFNRDCFAQIRYTDYDASGEEIEVPSNAIIGACVVEADEVEEPCEDVRFTWEQRICYETPPAPQPGVPTGFITNGPGIGNVSTYDLATQAVIQTYPVPFNVGNIAISADAQTIYTINQAPSPFALQAIDVATGVPTTINPALVFATFVDEAVAGFARNYDTGVFYVATSTPGNTPINIYEIDVNTGITTYLGSTAFTSAITEQNDIAWIPGNRLFLYSVSLANNLEIIEIDPTTFATINVIVSNPSASANGPITYLPRSMIGLLDGTLLAFYQNGFEIYDANGVSQGVTGPFASGNSFGTAPFDAYSPVPQPGDVGSFSRVFSRDCEGTITFIDYDLEGNDFVLPSDAEIVNCEPQLEANFVEVEQTILCDNLPNTQQITFIRHYIYEINSGTLLGSYDTELDGTTAFAVQGTVGRCFDLASEQDVTCWTAIADGVGYVIGDRVQVLFITNANDPTNPVLQVHRNLSNGTFPLPIYIELYQNPAFGTPIDIADFAPGCSETGPDVEQKTLCDIVPGLDRITFIRHYVYDLDGNVANTYDTEQDGITPYVIQGTLQDCYPVDTQLEVECWTAIDNGLGYVINDRVRLFSVQSVNAGFAPIYRFGVNMSNGTYPNPFYLEINGGIVLGVLPDIGDFVPGCGPDRITELPVVDGGIVNVPNNTTVNYTFTLPVRSVSVSNLSPNILEVTINSAPPSLGNQLQYVTPQGTLQFMFGPGIDAVSIDIFNPIGADAIVLVNGVTPGNIPQ